MKGLYCSVSIPGESPVELDPPGVERFYAARNRLGFLAKNVVDPFTDAVKRRPGYGDDNVPERPVDTEVLVGRDAFIVRAEPRVKRASASEIVAYAHHLFDEATDASEAGKRRLGMLTIEGEPYLRARDVLAALAEKRDEQTTVGATLKIASEPDPLPAAEVLVALDQRYGRLTPDTARTYRIASYALAVFGSVVKSFEGQLKERTGYSKESLPAETEEHWEPVGDHLFRVLSVPYPSPSYQAMVDALIAVPNGRKKVNGDLVRASGLEPVPEVLALRVRDGEAYLRLRGLQERLAQLEAEHTEPALRQNIEHYPHLITVPEPALA
ncbi:MAG TPA: hypothetical protein VJB16_06555 [archaeon]|nr:hypothetical protein [archaeon]